MKQLIVLAAMVALGVFIAGLVGGSGENTIKSSMSDLWQSEIVRQNTYP